MMQMWTDIGIFAATLLWVVLLVKLTRSWLPRKGQLALLIVAIGSGMVPFNGLMIGSYIFSLSSYLSIATILLLLAFLFSNITENRYETFKAYWSSDQQWLVVVIFFVLGGLLLYPMAGGLTMLDPYRLGYAGTPWSVLLLGYFFGWAVLCVLKRWYLLLVLILASVLAYYLKLLPSLNLWDYVIDPLVVVYSLFALLKCGLCRLFHRQPSN
jgi:hypothetical protein